MWIKKSKRNNLNLNHEIDMESVEHIAEPEPSRDDNKEPKPEPEHNPFGFGFKKKHKFF